VTKPNQKGTIMGIFQRPVFRPIKKQALPTKRPVSEWGDWDRIIPSRFPDPDLDALAGQVLAEFQRLAGAGALDGAHGRVLDRLAHDIMAPAFEDTRVRYNEGCRIIAMLMGQAVESAKAACRDAERLARAARDAENQADAVYARHVGLGRTVNKADGQIDWDAEAKRLAKRRLQLEADYRLLTPAAQSFRGSGTPDVNAPEPRPEAPEAPGLPAGLGNVVNLPARDDDQPAIKSA
jgi:hypothetical protein